MVEDRTIAYSIGFIESWIEKISENQTANPSNVLEHLKVIENAFVEYRKQNAVLRRAISEVKGRIDAASAL